MFRAPRVICIAALAALAVSCSGRGSLPQASVHPPTPQSVSPALVPPAPMAKTAILPSSAMRSPITSMSAIQGLNWAQIPGAASQVAAAPDGSLWALSTAPAGPDKYIWHYALGNWTNISGLAQYITVTPNGTLYAVNSGGGTFSYNGTSWTALGGGAAGITAAPDNSIYVLSNGAPPGSDQAIWHNVAGTWSQVPGSGVTIAASWDTAGPFAEAVGTIRAGGLYILNSAGTIFYENSDGSFAQLPGAASAIAPTQALHGTFVLGYTSNSNGNAIFYYDLNASQWYVQSGAGVAMSAGPTNLFVVASSGAIFTTPVNVVPQTLYVPNYTSSSAASISQWPINANGNQAPSSQLTGAATLLIGPTAVTRDTSGNIYVADFDAAAVDVFTAGASGNVAPVAQIKGALTGISGAEGIGVDSGGNIYISNRNANSVTIYAAGSNGNVAPARTVSGPATLLSSPQQIVVNSGGDFYISNSANAAIEYFSAAANGNVAPVRVISGSNTQLTHTFGMAVDSAGQIYALNGTSITIYPAGSNGNVAPTRTISGSNTGLTGNEGMAVDNNGNIYVTECTAPNSVLVFSATANGNVAPSQTIVGSSTGLNCPLKPAVF